MLEEAVEHLIKGIVDHPDDVHVEARSGARGGRGRPGGTVLKVRVSPDDLGKVIGRSGRTARALRTVVTSIGGKGVRVDIVDTDRASDRYADRYADRYR